VEATMSNCDSYVVSGSEVSNHHHHHYYHDHHEHPHTFTITITSATTVTITITIITTTQGDDILIWSLVEGKIVHRLKGHTKGVCSVDYHPKLPLLVSASFDGTVRCWK
jgi:WD40 repeat protein